MSFVVKNKIFIDLPFHFLFPIVDDAEPTVGKNCQNCLIIQVKLKTFPSVGFEPMFFFLFCVKNQKFENETFFADFYPLCEPVKEVIRGDESQTVRCTFV